MSAAAFEAWLVRLNLTDTRAAELLGCARNSVIAWRKRGTPLYIALACAALEAGLEPA